ncbi:hypothetical protein CcaverHIS002_0509210 [Cutaneotrichosporon cavernicola]|uniref:POP1-domain-containing protein n=1 Tax=Cutaneotrichosporon cavernicola TaxID=279322 RepID=A0AA48L7C8_9TREE|nr:uncharacterized protein CcaverHIS019_0509770 [Cutaneotrichosporon cavernicola]BEI85520.1 hypothetical protein CcaverHIS002_0509210 [Cutaneotrichosporon cavernicola]BEI93349.1 hypothetical protein CcaverHIS019_0509770 [Cutaneotrichosporon cavernicola]BEJ01128.1 hypothetical protein CcaverHIS631_0509850 [Cutaneotrichosporon cavernicola]BEJ08896.1 hypothetical protein CcaverHIS641_0509900 [Cutaneotrichosporon cavernicola]
MAPKQQSNFGLSNGAKKPMRSIQKTEDLLKHNVHAKRRGQGKERGVLKGLHDLVKTSNNLPGFVSVERFAETRALEIAAMQNAIKAASAFCSSRAFQSLPRHLRRRAASHNPRRVPKRLRSRAAAEIDPGDMTDKIHRKKAKLRARGDLRGRSRTLQLRARQVHKRWLGSHIFHAKRFHMANIWGYRLGMTPTLKGFRAAYRAARRRAIMQDTSFVGVIELQGTQKDIIALLSKVSAGTFTGNKYDGGMRVAHISAYHFGTFPLGLIGPVDVLWQPAREDKGRTVWLRVHPSIFDEVWETMTTAISAHSDEFGALLVHDLRDTLESFEITGPLAGQVLSRSMRICNSEPEDKKRALASLLHGDPAECPDGMIVGFKVYDPRLSYPPARIQETPTLIQSPWETLQTPKGVSTELWDADVRTPLSKPRWKKSDLDARRHQLDVPGTRLSATVNDDRVPVILIKNTVQSQTPGQEASGFHSWTLLIPHGWSMAFLPSFVYCNARLAGVVERRNRCREAGVPSFPEHYSSVCHASDAWEAQQSQVDQVRWLRKPPGKRPEFSVLGTRWPFRPVWAEVLGDAGVTSAEETATNGQAELRTWLFNPALAPCVATLVAAEDPAVRLLECVNVFRQRRGMSQLPLSATQELFTSALCQVQVEMIGRGSPSDMATITELDAAERNIWLNAHAQDQNTAVQHSGASELLKLGEEHSDKGVIGFVTTGNISLTRGEGHGLGMVSLAGYHRLLVAARQSPQPELAVVKIKNRDGHIFRLASLTLVQ